MMKTGSRSWKLGWGLLLALHLLAGCGGELEPEIALVPFASEPLGIQGLAPADWSETAQGVFRRAGSDADLTTLIQQYARGATADQIGGMMLAGLGPGMLPESSGTVKTANLSWTLYQGKAETANQGSVTVHLALAEDGAGAYYVMLQAPTEESEALYEGVFLPVVKALALLPATQES